MIAGTHSGCGKTTVTAGLLAALTDLGLKVGSAKVGPDFIDPGYHSAATGFSSRNLDPWICGEQAILPLAAQASAQRDLLVVEGVMGLFDGAAWSPKQLEQAEQAEQLNLIPVRQSSFGCGDTGASTLAGTQLATGSSAQVASVLQCPTVLVVDASSLAQSVAALVNGYNTFHPQLRLSGVICNRVASDSHEEMLRQALSELGVESLGFIRRDPKITWRDRHLGLVPVVESPQDVQRSLDRLSKTLAASCDVERLVQIARSADTLNHIEPLAPASHIAPVRIAVAQGKAFSFTYPDNLERLVQAGAEIVPFDPMVDPSLPEAIGGIYIGGGFPETYSTQLSENTALLDDLRSKARGLAIWAECAGMLWLSGGLDRRPLAGLIPSEASMTQRLTMGYRVARVHINNPVAAKHTVLLGHEFHYSALSTPGSALRLTGRQGSYFEGFADSRLFASYLHMHLGADPSPAERFVRTAAASPPPCAKPTSMWQSFGSAEEVVRSDE